ncbi:MAG TPA: glycoside hydrolase family 44 protein [Acidobacteriaceae bacterium]|jgi:hypothetical protein
MQLKFGLVPPLLAALPFAYIGAAAQTAPVQLSVNAAAGIHPIDPNIYGIANYGLDPQFAKEIALPNTRWGGDGTTRYNWQVDSSNSGGDWYFVGGSGVATPVPGGQVDTMIDTYRPAGTAPLITVPIIPYVNKTAAYTCSYRVSVYGPQTSVDPYLTVGNGDQCGSGVSPTGTNITDTNIYYNHVDNSPGLQEGWMDHLLNRYGRQSGIVRLFQLDNEPGGWGNTHRDVMPNGANYPTIVDLGQQYASMIKKVDPQALILGPSDFTLGGWIGDTTQQNGLYAGQYYLQQMAAYQHANGIRLLDYFDEHYYGGGSTPAAELQSTRALWDPTFNSGSWVEQYVFDAPMQLIPRFQSWIAQYYPGTKLALSEYSFTNGGTTIADALTQADVLGIFGRQGVDLANLWTIPQPTDPVAYSYRLYRNYDGQGSRYGDTWVSSNSTDQGQLAIYGAMRTSDHALTLVIINKTANDLPTAVALANVPQPAASAEMYTYSSANLQAIVRQPDIPIQIAHNQATGFSATFPAMSASIVVIPRVKH